MLARFAQKNEHWLVASLYIALVFAAGKAGLLPSTLWGLSLILSTFSFCLYASDKGATTEAQAQARERKLLAMDFVGGWPGGLVAQRLLGHKTQKLGYRVKFRIAVYGNIAISAFIFLGPHIAR